MQGFIDGSTKSNTLILHPTLVTDNVHSFFLFLPSIFSPYITFNGFCCIFFRFCWSKTCILQTIHVKFNECKKCADTKPSSITGKLSYAMPCAHFTQFIENTEKGSTPSCCVSFFSCAIFYFAEKKITCDWVNRFM